MSQTLTGLRSVLSKPWLYRGFIRLVGGDQAYRTFVADYACPSPGDKVLDIGCGPGHLLPYLSDVRYVGYDADAAYIKSARRYYGDRGVFHLARVGAPPPLQPGSFDLAIAFGVLHHLDYGLASCLFKEARQFLKPSGRLVTCDGCWDDGQSSVARRLLAADRGRHIRRLSELTALAQHYFSNVQGDLRHDLLRVPYSHGILTSRA